MSAMTKNMKLLNALQNGEELTERQIGSRFRLANPRATISALRKAVAEQGMNIYLNKRTNKRGKVFSKYRLGNARKAA